MAERRRSDHDEDNTPKLLAIGITLMVALMGFALFYVAVPKGNEQLIIQFTTGVLGVWGIATSFYYSTNKNAAKAQDTMNKQAAALQQAPTPISNASGNVVLPPGGEVKVEAAPNAEEGK